MTTTVCERGYEGMPAAELCIVVRELRRIRCWIGQFAELAAEDVDISVECTRGIVMTRTVVDALIQRAETALARATAGSAGTANGPVVAGPA